jgi:hypothetical protein
MIYSVLYQVHTFGAGSFDAHQDDGYGDDNQRNYPFWNSRFVQHEIEMI